MQDAKMEWIGVFRARCARFVAPSKQNIQLLLLALAVGILCAGLASESLAQAPGYDDSRIVNAVNKILIYLQGSFGALIMVCAGLGAIISSAFGQYRASLGLLVVAIGSFILRSIMSTFFNTSGIEQGY